MFFLPKFHKITLTHPQGFDRFIVTQFMRPTLRVGDEFDYEGCSFVVYYASGFYTIHAFARFRSGQPTPTLQHKFKLRPR